MTLSRHICDVTLTHPAPLQAIVLLAPVLKAMSPDGKHDVCGCLQLLLGLRTSINDDLKGLLMTRPTPFARFGVVAWIGGFVVFFVSQLAVGAAWSNPPYSWTEDNVSDLGNVYCQPWVENGRAAHYVCSPLHTLMNVAFVVEGLCVIAGVLLLRVIWRRSWLSRIAQMCLILAGLGLAVAGLAPADLNENVHVVFAALPIALFANVGLLLTGAGLNVSTVGRLRWVGPVLGLIGIIAAMLFLSHRDLGLGSGGMERLWGYNFLAWTCILGCALAFLAFRPSIVESPRSVVP